jgi:hypothetical protein
MSYVAANHPDRRPTDQQPEHSFYFFEANEFLREHLGKGIKAIDWVQFIKDMKNVLRTITVMGISGVAYVKTTAGKDYIILKGRAGQRPVGFQGTRYAAGNPTINFMTVGVKNMARAGARATGIAIVVCTAINIARALSGELDTFGKFAGTLSVDIAKCIVSAAVGWGFVALGTVALAAVTTLTAPVWVAMLVGAAAGLAASFIVDELADHYNVTSRVCNFLDRFIDRADDSISGAIIRARRYAGRKVRDAARWIGGQIGGAVRRWIEREFRQVFPRYRLQFL